MFRFLRPIKFLVFILFVSGLVCCSQEEDAQNGSPEGIPAQVGSLDDKISADSGAQVAVDFPANKELLDVILLLPDSVFSSWKWKLEDRKSWYKEIRENNYYVDNNPDFFRLVYFKPHSAEFTIVDGAWSVSIYKASDSSSIVITDDMPGDGNNLMCYEIRNNKIVGTITMDNVLRDYTDDLKTKNNSKKCRNKYEEINEPIFDFDFSEPMKIKIDGSWYLAENDYKECLKGNSLVYVFNPRAKKFNLEKITWKKKPIEKSI